MLYNIVLKINKIIYKLWHNCSSHGHNIEHNRQNFWSLLKSIISKKIEHNKLGLVDSYVVAISTVANAEELSFRLCSSLTFKPGVPDTIWCMPGIFEITYLDQLD